MIIIIFLIFIYVLYLRVNIFNHEVAFLLPWLLIFIFNFIEISSYHAPLNITTINIICFYLLSYIIGSNLFLKNNVIEIKYFYKINKINFLILIILFYIFSLFNIIYAGYLPIITGGSSHRSFGVSGFYGFYLAFSNVLAIASFYIYLRQRNKFYLFIYLSILFFFILFMTRLNVIIILISSLLVFNFHVKTINFTKSLTYFLFLLILFSFLGNFRVSDIDEYILTKQPYNELQTSIKWLYAYSFMNVLNLDNLINNTSAPYYDFSFFKELLPKLLKSENFHHEYYLIDPKFTVSTALSKIYIDLGIIGVVLSAIFFGYFTSKCYQKVITYHLNFFWIMVYATMYFCATFSFFNNFWVFLPVIFQIPLAWLVSRIVFKKEFK